MSKDRFIRIEDPSVIEESNSKSGTWWYDTARPFTEGDQPYMAIEVRPDKNPNDFVKCVDMKLVFQDQAEYYAVCGNCYSIYCETQWSGSTRGGLGWRERANKYLERHQKLKGWCEFCDPIFGNGGWRL